MIARKTPDGKQLLIGLNAADLKRITDTSTQVFVRHKGIEISIFATDGGNEELEFEFLRIVTGKKAQQAEQEKQSEQGHDNRASRSGPRNSVHAKRRGRRKRKNRH